MSTELTELESKIIKAAAESAGTARRVTLEEIAEKAGCSPDAVLKRLGKNPEFQQLFKEALKNSLTAEIPEVLCAFLEQAKTGSFKHGKLFFEMVGLYQEEKRIKADVGVTQESPFKSKEERDAFIKNTLLKLGEGGTDA